MVTAYKLGLMIHTGGDIMRKNVSKILVAVMVLALMVAIIGAVPAAAAETEFTAKLGYADADWTPQEWDNVTTTVTGAGQYTLSWDVGDTPAEGIMVFVIDIVGAQAALSADNRTYKVTDLTISVDGSDVPVDISKLSTGDLESNGNYRIEVYNEWGATKADCPVDTSLLAISSNLTVTFTIDLVDAATGEVIESGTPAPTEPKPSESEPSKPENPKTGDAVAVVIALLAVSSLGIACVSGKKV